jgi:hypothetical protein
MKYHTHDYYGETSYDEGHAHGYRGRTTSAPTGIPHIHYIEGYTSKDDGHRHYYKIETSVDYPDTCNGHFHYISGTTEEAGMHIHLIQNVTTGD